MSIKIDFSDIVSGHLKTLIIAETGRISIIDLVIFFAVPILLGIFGIWFKPNFDDNIVAIIIAAFAIFGGLLINVLVLLYTVKEVGPTEDEKKNQLDLIKQLNYNLLFSILLALVAIIVMCVMLFLTGILIRIFIGISIALSSCFILTLFMALKRLNALLALRFK